MEKVEPEWCTLAVGRDSIVLQIELGIIIIIFHPGVSTLGFFVSLHPSADTLAVYNSAKYILHTHTIYPHSDTHIHLSHETLMAPTSPGASVYVYDMYIRACVHQETLTWCGLRGTEFLGTDKIKNAHRGHPTLLDTEPKFFPIRDFYILPLMVVFISYRESIILKDSKHLIPIYWFSMTYKGLVINVLHIRKKNVYNSLITNG